MSTERQASKNASFLYKENLLHTSMLFNDCDTYDSLIAFDHIRSINPLIHSESTGILNISP